MSLWGITGAAALGLVVMAWLVVSFSAPTPRRTVVEWLGATGLYLGLSSLFARLLAQAWEQDNTPAMVGFGFLLFLFVSGGLVSLVHMLLALRGPGKERQSAVN